MQPFDELSSASGANGRVHDRTNGSGERNGARKAAQQDRNGRVDAGGCASLLLETMPRVLRAMRVGLSNGHRERASGNGGNEGTVTVPQYRTLVYLRRHEGASLSELAEFMGLTLPSASKLVDHLVKRAILLRQADSADRRKMTLRISRKGDALFNNAQERVRLHLAGMLAQCDGDALRDLGRALGILQESFPPLGGDFQKTRESAVSGKSVTRRTSTP